MDVMTVSLKTASPTNDQEKQNPRNHPQNPQHHEAVPQQGPAIRNILDQERMQSTSYGENLSQF